MDLLSAKLAVISLSSSRSSLNARSYKQRLERLNTVRNDAVISLLAHHLKGRKCNEEVIKQDAGMISYATCYNTV